MGGSRPQNPNHNSELFQVLNLQRLPGRIDARMTAYLLGVPDYTIPILVRCGVLTPLGLRDGNFQHYFSSVRVLALAADPAAMHEITLTLQNYWKEAERRKNRSDR